MIQIGVKTKTVNNQKRYTTYFDMPAKLGEWIDAEVCLPKPYDLVEIEIKGKGRRYAWHTGCEWDGLNISSRDIVSHWKRNEVEAKKHIKS